ncbi:MAG TPA: hypothetical protein VF219_22955 [Vicinamibacterales bacterium]
MALPELILVACVLVVGFLALLAVGLAIFISVSRQSAPGGKICPFCAERIQAAAVICRFCNRDVANVNVPPA